MLGLIGKKLGMTQVFNEVGNIIPVTLIQVDTNYVVGERNKDKNGYEAVVIGSQEIKDKHATKPYKGQFPEGVKPTKCLMEIRDFGKECSVGDALDVDLFEGIAYVDVRAVSKGKGFQGVMKRHGFSGGRATHGSKFHRANGSTGQASFPSKVLRGTRMAGRMGGDKKTVQNLQLVKIDKEQKILVVKGAIPGRKNSTVLITKAKKK